MGNEAAALKSNEPMSAIDALRPRFLQSLQQRRMTISRIHAAFSEGKFKTNDLEELSSITHKLRGSAASYFYKDLSTGAGVLEDCLKKNNIEENKGDVIEHLEALLRLCDQALTDKNPARDKEPDTDRQENRDATILLVEDDLATQALLKAIIKDDATVSIADSIDRAIVHVENNEPDLVIVDNHLACGGTGIDLVRRLGEMPQAENIPVIMMTASSEPADHIRAMLSGVVDFVVKPIAPQEFAAKIRKFLQAQQFTVLIADDNEGVRALLTHKFREQAVNAIEAQNNDELMQMTAEHKPDLIITDCALPELDLALVIGQTDSDTQSPENRVILLTAIQNEKEILDLLRHGAIDYIAKPFNADIVVSRCMRLIDLNEHMR